MKKIGILVLGVILLGIWWASGSRLVSAHSFHVGTTVTIANKPVYETIIVGGQNIDIENEVFGDVICGGQTVTISGIIHGDVICAGQTVNVSGTIDGDVRLVGQTVTLGAQVSGNATIGGQSFTSTATSRVGGDMAAGSADVILHGTVGRDIAVASNTAVIAGAVGRNIEGVANQLSLADTARVNGNIEFTSKNSLNKSSGATIAGTVTRHIPEQAARTHHTVWGFGLVWLMYWLAATLLISTIIALLFPLLHQVTEKAMPWPWKALLVGFLATTSLPFVLLVLVMTIIGIPLAVLVLLAWMVMAMLSAPIFAYYIGRQILRQPRHVLLTALVGTGVVVVASLIPILGFLVLLASFLIGSGALLLEIFRRTPKPVYHFKKEG